MKKNYFILLSFILISFTARAEFRPASDKILSSYQWCVVIKDSKVTVYQKSLAIITVLENISVVEEETSYLPGGTHIVSGPVSSGGQPLFSYRDLLPGQRIKNEAMVYQKNGSSDRFSLEKVDHCLFDSPSENSNN